jgi:hypothetical protein
VGLRGTLLRAALDARDYVVQLRREKVGMQHHVSGWDAWVVFWMVPLMLLWLAVLGGVVYMIVTLAVRHERHLPAPR